MGGSSFKKYARSAKAAIKGESFFESLICDFALPHRVGIHADLGVDYLCEWTSGDRPTGILFAVQVKFRENAKPQPDSRKLPTGNGLPAINVRDRHLKIDDRTLGYWRSLALPCYLIVAAPEQSNGVTVTNCYYKRYSPFIDGRISPDDRSPTKWFFSANNGHSFRAYADEQKKIGGFARDLIVDYARLCYFKGQIVRLRPRDLGFWPFEQKPEGDKAFVCFPEIVEWHKKQIAETHAWTGVVLAGLNDSRKRSRRKR